MLRKILDVLLNSELADVQTKAREVVRSRLLDRTRLSVEEMLTDCSPPPELIPRAKTLLLGLADIIQVSAGHLRCSDVLGDLLRVPSEALGDAAATAWRKSGMGDSVEVFGYDIMYLVETRSERRLWNLQRNLLERPPQSEDEWIDLIMTMTVGDFVTYFAKTMSPDLTSD